MDVPVPAAVPEESPGPSAGGLAAGEGGSDRPPADALHASMTGLNDVVAERPPLDPGWAPLAARARAQRAALFSLSQGRTLSPSLLRAIGGGDGERAGVGDSVSGLGLRRVGGGRGAPRPPPTLPPPSQTGALRAALSRTPRVINAAAPGAWPMPSAPPRAPLAETDFAAARHAAADANRRHLHQAAVDAARRAGDGLDALIRAKGLLLAPLQATLRAAAAADAASAAAAADPCTLAEWTRWRVAAPWELGLPPRAVPPPASARAAAVAAAPSHRRDPATAPDPARLAAALAAAQAERAVFARRAALAADALSALRSDAGLRACRAAADKRRAQRNNAVRAWHGREARRAAAARAARVAALRGADYGEYLRLAARAKDARLTELLARTDAIVETLVGRVPAQRASVGGGAVADDVAPLSDSNADDCDPSLDPASAALLDTQRRYYRAVHAVRERVSQPSALTGGALRPYQLTGLRFLSSLVANRVNGILADDMGLGKTVQAIALVARAREAGACAGPHLILDPKAVLPNWGAEFARWAPGLDVVVYDGGAEERKALRAARLPRGGGQPSFDALITHYDLALRDTRHLKPVQWGLLIVDEGHRLKNADAALSRALRALTAAHRILLTGTPLQNSLHELWALLNFVLPKVFDSAASFDEWFGEPLGVPADAPAPGSAPDAAASLTDEEQLLVITRLHQVLRPFVLRRTKAEVEADLPPAATRVLRCGLSAWQAAWYKQLATTGGLHVAGGGRKHRGGLRNVAMQLRKACLHPHLFLPALDPPSYEPAVDELVRSSGKLALLDGLLAKLSATGHRVLLFSQMTRALDILSEFLVDRGHPHLRLDGGTKTDDRARLLEEFNAPSSPHFVFLLSTRAGGLGLNLQTADTVIMFDSDWNPAADAQAAARAHRIGQTRGVLVLVLVAAGTIEEAVLDRAASKRALDAKVIQAGLFNDDSTHRDRTRALKALLRGGGDGAGEGVAGPAAVNAALARGEGELAVFERIDADRAAAAAATGLPELLGEDEVPEFAHEAPPAEAG